MSPALTAATASASAATVASPTPASRPAFLLAGDPVGARRSSARTATAHTAPAASAPTTIAWAASRVVAAAATFAGSSGRRQTSARVG